MLLQHIKKLITEGEYEISSKVGGLIEEGYFELADIESCILTATEIYKRERDELKQSVDGYKYVIIGRDTSGLRFYSTGKMMIDYVGRYYFVITAHQAE